ncbi:hypothetical protein MLD38_002967 [Melastoma candidum]|uniref:Uncharacterized protein n=1 Tax=Melastoma candidum TaxID=119954 RepID=A0ACB9S2E4_9MYRT|nr:hypothetical protein MLD38_002967 [Melastoma candidum]
MGSRPEDTALTKIFVGGLAWGTRRDGLRAYFEKFGEVEDAVVIVDGISGRSRGYGFVTFKDAEAARKACEEDPYPMIDGRRANCNLASLGARKNRPYALSPHPGSGKWRQRSGPPSRQESTFKGVAPPSPQILPSRTWEEPRSHPPYQYPALSHSLYTMNYYNTFGGQYFPTYYRPQHLNYDPIHQRPSHVASDTMHYRKSVQNPVIYGQLYRPQFREMPSPAMTGRSREQGRGATPKKSDHKQSAY